MKALVTGGAGFIGSFIVDGLVEQGHEVAVYDNLDPQVHGASGELPGYLNKNARIIKESILNEDAFYNAVKDADVLFHQAAVVGVGQSMYQVRRYVEQNSLGAGAMLDVIVNKKNKLKKIIVASSMSIYGEGKYTCEEHGTIYPPLRTDEQLKRKEWKVKCPECGRDLFPVPTDELK
ncbi:MAG: NAD-dependent epimerase/dehydratase family protein, partial [Candidatus Omnitrophota bacterium]